MKGVFVTATGTAVGKTWFSCALAGALKRDGKTVAAIKPMETGCAPEPLDAIALAEACGRPDLANAPGLYRAADPLAPYAVEKNGGPSIGSLPGLVQRVKELAEGSDIAIVEGAGGVLVPLDGAHSMRDFASQLGWPVIVVTHDALGVLSYTLTAIEALRSERIPVAGIVLNRMRHDEDDISPASNQAVLQDCLPDIPIITMPNGAHWNDAVDAVSRALQTFEIV